jgi:hypothetical protein
LGGSGRSSEKNRFDARDGKAHGEPIHWLVSIRCSARVKPFLDRSRKVSRSQTLYRRIPWIRNDDRLAYDPDFLRPEQGAI